MALGGHIYCVCTHVCICVPVQVCMQVYVYACMCVFVQAASWREGSLLGENGFRQNAMYLSNLGPESQPVGCLQADSVHRAMGEPGLCLSSSLMGLSCYF